MPDSKDKNGRNMTEKDKKTLSGLLTPPPANEDKSAQKKREEDDFSLL